MRTSLVARFAALIALGLALLVPWSEPRVEAQIVIRVVPVDNFLIYKNIIRLDRPK